MTPEDQKTLLSEIINTAQESKNHIAKGTPERNAINRIIRLAKILYVNAIKCKETEVPPSTECVCDCPPERSRASCGC